ncbi:hypothetical protein GF351_05710 [Candidatus Woesearchaeota archaeon]|nr:hypothetical protein [Candidatus Woesearchaeota archaeon]
MKLWSRIIILAAMLTALSSFCSADEGAYEFTIIDDWVHVEKTIRFDQQYTGILELNTPEDAKAVSVYVNEVAVEYRQKLVLSDINSIRINYLTGQYLDRHNFIADIGLGRDIAALDVKVILPEGRPLKTREGKGSVYPKPDVITSDGRSIILNWKFEEVEADEDIPLLVIMQPEKDYVLPMIWLLAAVVLIFIYIISRKRTKAMEKAAIQIPESKEDEKTGIKDKQGKQDLPDAKKGPEPAEPAKTADSQGRDMGEEMLEHLKEDEKQIIRVLRLKEGSCEQGTLRIATNFSKAKLSRILMELEQRRIVYKEQRGKKNVVFLKE